MEMSLATLERIESAPRGQAAERTWQREAIEVYRRAKLEEESVMRAELANRVAALTGCRIPPQQVVADRDARIAFLVLDGVRFRLQRHEVVLLRPCAHCGTGEFVSSPLLTRGNVGHALDIWQPLHRECEAVDPTEW